MLSQVECKKADKGKTEEVKATTTLTDGTIYLKAKFSTDATEKKAFADKGDRVVTCDFYYSLDGKKFQKLGEPFRVREGQWIGAKMGTFCTRPYMVTNDGGWVDVDWFRVTKK